MRKWFLIIAMGMLLVFPALVSAQGSVTLASVNVQLWPEYDQPSMLVLADIELPATTLFPVKLTFQIPQDANLVAVATYSADGSLVNAMYEGPAKSGDLQAFTVTLDAAKARFEYYQPIEIKVHERTFSYLWNGDYAIDAFGIRVLEPLDTTALTTTPKLGPAVVESGLTYYESNAIKLKSGQQFTLDLKYTKTTDALVSSQQDVQPAAPVDENTPGRVSLNNSLPYIIGGLGVVMIAGGLVYYWQAGRSKSTKQRPRRRVRAVQENEENGEEEVYCAQCGTRAKPNDRFCRVCGGRIRRPEE
ncbi:MAG: zinc ribbon domain-containing protein [Chloroflexi bacterium]|nr:zinc ribbon domain-containing protein [Chloroflexota bacterium]